MGNTAFDGAGILNYVPAAVTLWNTIVAAEHLGGDLDGLFAGGSNLIGDGSGGIAGTIRVPRSLGPLTWNGRPDPDTSAPPSAALDRCGDGPRILVRGVVTDQRGVPRIKHGVLDIAPSRAAARHSL